MLSTRKMKRTVGGRREEKESKKGEKIIPDELEIKKEAERNSGWRKNASSMTFEAPSKNNEDTILTTNNTFNHLKMGKNDTIPFMMLPNNRAIQMYYENQMYQKQLWMNYQNALLQNKMKVNYQNLMSAPFFPNQ